MRYRTGNKREFVVNARNNGRLRLMQWANTRWKVYVKPYQSKVEWQRRSYEETRDEQGWTIVDLKRGTWLVSMEYKYGQ